jgi:glucokinase
MAKYAIGIDIGGTRTKIGLVDIYEGRVLDLILSPTERNDSELFISGLYSQYCSLLEKSGITKDIISGIGIGAPGFVYADGSVDSTFGFLPFMDAHYPLKERLEHKFKLPCRVDNDARIVALGEALYGRGKGFGRVLVLTLGTGLGLGLIVNGKFETKLPYAHLGGHITIATRDIKCYCGRQGCMEALVSATGIIEAASRSGWEKENPDIPLNAETVFETANNGNNLAISIISDLIENLKTGISNFIAIFAPDIIIIGGGVSKGLIPYLDQLRQLQYLNPFTNYNFEIVLSELDEHSGILGGAALFIPQTNNE